MKVLVAENDCERQYIITILENLYAEITSFEASSDSMAKEILGKQGKMDLIVLSKKEVNDREDSECHQTLQDKDWSTPVILYEKDKDIADQIIELELNFERRNLQDYLRVRTPYFWRFNHSISDTYVALSDIKFVKILNKDDIYNREIIEKYAKKNQAYLFVYKDDYLDFLRKLLESPYLSCVNEDAQDDEAAVTTLALSGEIVRRVGITENVIDMANTFVRTVVKSKAKNDLEKLLKKARKTKDYIYDHSYLLSFVCTSMCSHISWSTDQIIEKFCLAAMFHDITLDDPEMAMLQDLNESVLLKYSAEQINEYTNHPEQVVRLIKNAKKFPLNIDEIVLQHHENPEGNGFPKKLSAGQVSKLSAVFIVAHEFVTQLYQIGFNERLVKGVIQNIQKRYEEKAYSVALDALEAAFVRE